MCVYTCISVAHSLYTTDNKVSAISYFCVAEIHKTQSSGKPTKDQKYVDIYREKPIRVAVKVLVPVREHPKVS